MKKITITIITVLMLGLYSTRYAHSIDPNAGTTSAQFLKIGIGARAIGLGGAYTSVEGDVSSIYWNPAGLAAVDNVQVLCMFSDWLAQATYSNILVGVPLENWGTVGLMLNHLQVNEIIGLDEFGFASGLTYRPYDMAVTLSWAKNFSALIQPGVNIKLINSMLVENLSFSAVALDIGSQFKFDAIGRTFNAGFAIKNLSASSSSGYTLPVNFGVGVSVMLFDNFLIALDSNVPFDDAIGTSFGVEYVMERDAMDIAFRFGNKSGYEGLDSSAGFSIGTGIIWKELMLDVTWNPHGELGNNVAMSLIYNF